MRDALQRPLRTLRLSVTDRCNYRCAYCMPREPAFLDRQELLSFEEMERLGRILARRGVRKIRITGGEPLVRRDLPDLVRRLAGISGIETLALTTNGSLLTDLAHPLRKAGLSRVTVSLDTLDPQGYARMSGTGAGLGAVLEGLAAARAAGLQPLKLNCVVRRGINESQVLPIAAFAREQGFEARFIEFMDVGTTNNWERNAVVPVAELRDLVTGRWPLAEESGGEGPAVEYRYLDGAGTVGFIASVSQPFCRGCDRIRLSAEGKAFACLFGTAGVDLRGPLRAGATDAELDRILQGLWSRRADRYSEVRGLRPQPERKEEMFRIGG